MANEKIKIGNIVSNGEYLGEVVKIEPGRIFALFQKYRPGNLVKEGWDSNYIRLADEDEIKRFKLNTRKD